MSTTDLSAAEPVQRGDRLTVRDACGRLFRKRALGPVMAGHNFPVVWMCSEEEWAAARAERREADGRPWPIEDIQSVEASSDEREVIIDRLVAADVAGPDPSHPDGPVVAIPAFLNSRKGALPAARRGRGQAGR